MRVCLVTPEFPPMQGGVGDYTSHLALAIRKLGLEVVVLTSGKAKPRPGGAVVFDRVVPSVENWSLSCWGSIVNYIHEFRPDVVHIQYQTAGYDMHPAINLFPARLRFVGNRPRVAVTFHDLKVPYLFPKAGPVRQLPAYFLAGQADAVVVTNPEDYRGLSKHTLVQRVLGARIAGNTRRLFTIPIGSNIPKEPPVDFDRERWRMGLGVEEGEVLLVYFGFLNQSKGLDVLLEAFSKVLETGFKARLLMAGGSFGDSDPTNVDYGKRLMAQVEASEYRSRVIWTGFTSREEVTANLLASDICVLPFNEGASLRHGSLMAALVHELPIITTSSAEHTLDHPSFPSLYPAVKLVPPRDAGALAKAISELGCSKPARETLSKAVGKLVPAFEWDTIGEAHSCMYDSLFPARRGRSNG